MPYARPDIRADLDAGAPPTRSGELNYVLTRVIQRFLASQPPGYEAFNTVVGALECAKLEFYRRAAAPYEDIAKERNGDVY